MIKILVIGLLIFFVVSLLLGRRPLRSLGLAIGQFIGGVKQGMDSKSSNTNKPHEGEIIDIKAKEKDV